MKQKNSSLIGDDVKLSVKEKISYALGDFASNMAFQMVSLYLLFFYTDVFGLTAAAAGIIYLIVRIIDAATDLAMGYLADHTRTRWGRHRPYLLFGAVPFAVSLVLCFTTPAMSSTGKFIYALLTYNLLCLTYTVVNIPYAALTTVMTRSAQERTIVSSYRIVFATIATILLSVATKPFVAMFSDPRTGYQLITIIYGAISVVLFWICFYGVRERLSDNTNVRFRLKDIWPIIFQNRPLLFLLMAALLTSTALLLRHGVAIYYFKYNINQEELVPVYLLAVTLASTAAIIMAPGLTKRWSNKKVYSFGLLIVTFFCTVLYFVPFTSLGLIFIISILGSFGAGLTMVCSWAILPEAVEYAEWKTGIRSEGIIYGVFNMVQKIAMAASGIIPSFIMSITNYVPNAQQTPEALMGLSSLISVIPALCFLGAFIFLFFYPLKKEDYLRIVEDLRQRGTAC